MTRIKQKVSEYNALIRFLNMISETPKIQGINEGEDPPDYVVTFKHKVVSIEHTRFMNKSQKQIEEFRKSIIIDAQNEFEKIYGKTLSVQFNFSNEPMRTTKDKPKSYYTKILLDLVLEIYEINKERNFSISTKLNSIENKFINSITISNQREIFPWETCGAFLVQKADFKVLQNIIYKKSEDVKKYKTRCDENWLLIEAGIGNKSTGYYFDDISDELQKENFDKIFLMDYRAEQFLEV
ncbi:hypothetical protein [uncultured Winogradskyella sp.]|uniref:hypothetical protein n=1 Tax=uncultured Winogradskyella sp. TaxID=395353 RepID=UPI002611407D|nr:hypothetical protein [uncultured Winogradskyella sp.]